MTATTKVFNGKRYYIATTRVSKTTALAEAKKYRNHGCLARVVQEERGKWSVYTGTTYCAK